MIARTKTRTPKTRFAIYAVGGSASINSQPRACREFIAARGGTIADGTIFTDAMPGGTMFKALATGADLAALRGEIHAKPRRIDMLVVDKMTRLAGDINDGERLFHRLLAGTDVLCATADGRATFGPFVGLRPTRQRLPGKARSARKPASTR